MMCDQRVMTRVTPSNADQGETTQINAIGRKSRRTLATPLPVEEHLRGFACILSLSTWSERQDMYCGPTIRLYSLHSTSAATTVADEEEVL